MNFIRQTFKNSNIFNGFNRMSKKMLSWGTNNLSVATARNTNNILEQYNQSMMSPIEPINISNTFDLSNRYMNLNFLFPIYQSGTSILDKFKFKKENSSYNFNYLVDNYYNNLNSISFCKMTVKGPMAKKDIESLISGKIGNIGEVKSAFLNNHAINISYINSNKFTITFDSTLTSQSLNMIKKQLSINNTLSECLNKVVFNISGSQTRKFLECVFKTKLDYSSFPFLTSKNISVDNIDVTIIRPSFKNEIGWELYLDYNHAKKIRNILDQKSKRFGIGFNGHMFTDSLRINDGYSISFDSVKNIEESISNEGEINSMNYEFPNSKYIVYSYVPSKQVTMI